MYDAIPHTRMVRININYNEDKQMTGIDIDNGYARYQTVNEWQRLAVHAFTDEKHTNDDFSRIGAWKDTIQAMIDHYITGARFIRHSMILIGFDVDTRHHYLVIDGLNHFFDRIQSIRSEATRCGFVFAWDEAASAGMPQASDVVPGRVQSGPFPDKDHHFLIPDMRIGFVEYPDKDEMEIQARVDGVIEKFSGFASNPSAVVDQLVRRMFPGAGDARFKKKMCNFFDLTAHLPVRSIKFEGGEITSVTKHQNPNYTIDDFLDDDFLDEVMSAAFHELEDYLK